MVKVVDKPFDSFEEPADGKGLLRLLVKIPVFLVTLLIFVFLVTQYRCIWKWLSYVPISEEAAMERMVELKTTMPTEMLTIGPEKTKINVPAGTTVKVLGVDMIDLNMKITLKPNVLAPNDYYPSKYYVIELPDGTRGGAPLPEMLVGGRIVVNQEGGSGDTLVVSSVKKNSSKDAFPYDFYVAGRKKAYHWGEFTYVKDDWQTVIYASPLQLVPENKQRKATWVPPFMKIPAYMRDGFFLFPKYASWNAYQIPPIFRSMIAIGAWLLLAFIALRIVKAIKRREARKARECIADVSLSRAEVFQKADKYYFNHTFPWAAVVNCIWPTHIIKDTFCKELAEDLSKRCPQCGGLTIVCTRTGEETERKFLRRVYSPSKTFSKYERLRDGGEKVLKEHTLPPRYVDHYSFAAEYYCQCNECGFKHVEWRSEQASRKTFISEAEYKNWLRHRMERPVQEVITTNTAEWKK